MSTTYTDLTETLFPDSIDTLTRMSDISSSDIALVTQYTGYIETGSYESAAALLDANPTLQTKIFNALKFNKIADGMISLQRYFKNDLQTYLNSQLTYIGEYSAETIYEKTNIVTYNGEGFICRVASSVGTAPTAHATTTNWAMISKQGVQGVSGTGLSPRGVWVNTTQYYTNDCVSYNNMLWQSLANNIGSEPTVLNTTKWLNLLNNDHKHGNITLDGKIGETGNLPVFTTTGGVITTKSVVESLSSLGIGFAICNTPAVDQSKTAQLDGFYLGVSSIVGVLFTYGNENTTATLNISSTAHAQMYCYGSPVTAEMITAGMLAFFIYDGASWQLINPAVPQASPFVAQTTAPTNIKLLWIDTSNGNVLRFYNGSMWMAITSVWG